MNQPDGGRRWQLVGGFLTAGKASLGLRPLGFVVPLARPHGSDPNQNRDRKGADFAVGVLVRAAARVLLDGGYQIEVLP